ncbi:MAG: HD domain-containing protein [Clostridia bacterium]
MTFYEEIYKLKTIIRKGWQERDVQGRVESDAEHTFSMALLGLEIMSKNKLKLDELKVLKMIIYHELCEIDVGDITPFDKVSKEDKFNKEHACIKRISKDFNMPEIENIWLEFEECLTSEAKFVKKLDKYDAVLQSQIYAESQNKPELYLEFKNFSKSICDDMEKYKL